MNKFNQSICEELGYYVYGLKNPITKEYFYVGKGLNNRMYDHVKCAISTNTINDCEKFDIIRDLENKGHHVEYTIFAHKLTEEESYKFEAYTIKLLNNIQKTKLSNEVSGHHDKLLILSESDILQYYGYRVIPEQEIFENKEIKWQHIGINDS